MSIAKLLGAQKSLANFGASGLSRINCWRGASTASHDKRRNDMFEVLEEAEAEDSGFENWLAAAKASLAETKGPYWLGKGKVLSRSP
jgi:hypothetical protein